ncbi:MAG: ATP-binding protein [Spirochaetota bacterium]
MNNTPFTHARLRFALLGAAIGALFPALAVALVYALEVDPVVLIVMIGLTVPVLAVVGWILGGRDDRARAMRDELESEIHERTAAIRNMLDVAGDGFLTFGPDYRVHPEYSKACEEIFNGKVAGRRFPDLIYTEAKPRQEFVEGLDLYFMGKAKAEVIFDLLDRRVQIRDRTIELAYRAIDDETVMCALTDVTEQEQLEATVKAQNRRRDLILRVVSHRKYFASFVDEANELFQVLETVTHRPQPIDAAASRRLATQVHTFKANASFLGFSRTSEVAHSFEDQLAALPILQGEIDLGAESFVLKRQFYEEYNIVADTLGERWINDLSSVSVPVPLMRKVEQYIKARHADDPVLVRAMEQLRSVPIADLFSRYPQLVEDLAGRQGRRVKPVEVLGGEFRVLPDRYESLANALTHLARNMIDHGIESPSERELKGKPPEGEIRIEITRDSGDITIAFSDDGRGISFAAVEERARSRGLIRDGRRPSRAQLLTLLFGSGFSTADRVTPISGRGVGLTAVHEEVRKLGGRIAVETHPGRGTAFRITVPEHHARNEGRRQA